MKKKPEIITTEDIQETILLAQGKPIRDTDPPTI